MTIDINEFYNDIFQEAAGHSEQGQFMEASFTEVFCNYLIDAGEFDTFDALYFQTNRGIRVDGYAGDPIEDDGVLTLFVSDFCFEDSPESLTRTDIERSFKRLLRFFEFSMDDTKYTQLEESSDAYTLAQFVNSRKDRIHRLRLFLLSNKLLSKRVDGMEVREIDGIPVTFNVWDISRLHRLLTSKHGKEDIKINLVEEFGKGLPCLPAHVGGDSYESYLAVVPGNVLAELYDRWGARLLEQNVRCFLQARGQVNKGIKNTILNEPGMFFAYNNGITATAENVVVEEVYGQPILVEIGNLQIVNGGQTTASIFNAMKKEKANLDRIFVQMKLSVVNEERDVLEVVPKISQYANAQNRVNAADFFSNHPFHIRMEDFSRKVYAPQRDGAFMQSQWFYERARGQYMDARSHLTIAQRKEFDKRNPKNQSFTKTDMAKFQNVWNQVPHVVSQGAQKNFAEFAKRIGSAWEKSSDDFNEMYFKHLVAKAIIFRTLEKSVMKEDWYEGGYRANIVAYTIASLAHIVSEADGAIDFNRIWEEQQISPALESALLKIAGTVYHTIIEPPEGIRNISEWAKKKDCWEKVKRLPLAIPEELVDELLGDEDLRNNAAEARGMQRIDNGIEAQQRVLALGAPFWRKILEWEHEKTVLTPSKVRLVDKAARMTSSRFPNEGDSMELTGILDELKREGCPHVQRL